MRRRALSLLVAAALAATVTIIGGATAVAHPTWTVGPLASGTFNFVGYAAPVRLRLGNSYEWIVCESSTAYGNGSYGYGQSGTSIARITNSTWTNCTGSNGITFTVTHIGTWNLNAGNHTTTGATGTITNVAARLSGPFCSVTVSGWVGAEFFNSTPGVLPALDIPPAGTGLFISSVSGCFGLIHSGETAALDGTYTINPPSQLTITD